MVGRETRRNEMSAFTRQLLAALLASLAPCFATAAAAQSTGVAGFPGMSCPLGRDCSIQVGPGMTLEGPETAFTIHPDGRGFDFLKGDESLYVRLCADSPPPCFEAIRGTRRAELPALGFLADFVTPQPPLSTVGLDSGERILSDVPKLESFLDPDVRYLVYHTQEQGFEASIPGLDLPSFSSGGETTTLVVSYTDRLEDGFFYFEGKLPKFPFDGKKKQDGEAPDGQDSTPSDDSGDATGDGSQSAQDAQDSSGASSQDGAEGTDPGAEAGGEEAGDQASEPGTEQEQEQEQKDDGSDEPIQIAVSFGGRLPFEPAYTKDIEEFVAPFSGHLLLDGQVPLSALLVMDGRTVLDIDPDRDGDHPFNSEFYSSVDLQIGGNGKLLLEIPYFDLLPLDMQLGDATAQARVSDLSDRAAFSGIADSDRFLNQLPVPIVPSAGLAVSGAIDSQDLVSSFVHAEGDMGLDLHPLGQMLQLDLPTLAAAGTFDLNASGLALSGRTSTALRSDLSYGEVGVEMHIPPAYQDFLVALTGDMVVGGQPIAGGRVEMSSEAATIAGTLQMGTLRCQMKGDLLPDGHRLTGTATTSQPISVEPAELAAAADALLSDQKRRDDLEAIAAAARELAATERARWQAAANDVAAARAEVDRLSALVSSYTASRDAAYKSYRSWVNKSCAWYQASCIATRAANISYYWGKYVSFEGLRASTAAARVTAMSVLSGLEIALRTAELAATAAEAASAVAATQLDEAAAALAASRARYEALRGLEAQVLPIVLITLENGVVTTGVSAVVNGVEIADGHVDVEQNLACLDVPGLGERCGPL
jgi:hypothetical protein